MTTGIRELLGRHQLVVMRLIRNGHQYLGVPIDETSTKVLNSLIGAMVNATIAGSDDEPLRTPISFIARVSQLRGRPVIYMPRRISALLEEYWLGNKPLNALITPID